MPESLRKVEVAVESVDRRAFAIAYDWPGWARSGRDEASAIQALLNYGLRYAAVFESTAYAFQPPDSIEAFKVIERLEGNSTTAFGAPAIPIQDDERVVKASDLTRMQKMMEASWRTFDQALSASQGLELRKGPRGGGRNQSSILAHVISADESYLAKLGWKFQKVSAEDPLLAIQRLRDAIMAGLQASVRGDIPREGPRGGTRWTPRFFVRRVLWHILDHAWEIEDRMSKVL